MPPVVSLLGMLACTGRAPDPSPEIIPDEDGGTVENLPADDTPDWQRPTDHIVMVDDTPTNATAAYQIFSLASGEVTTLSPMASLPRGNRPDHYQPIATAQGDRWAVAMPEKDGFAIVVHTITNGTSQQLSLGQRQPAALHLIGDTLIVGAGNEVGYLNLTAEEPLFTLEHKQPNMQFKAYDRFARQGDWLLAVDDVVSPIFADFFHINAQGVPSHEAGIELPGVINGTYEHVALVGTRAEGTVYAVTPYGIMSGSGHNLAALPIVDNALDIPEERLVLNSWRGSNGTILEEHVSRVEGHDTTLLIGDTFTQFTGMAIFLDHVLIAAGERGLLMFPMTLESETPTVVALDGNVRDVLATETGVYTLVQHDDGGCELVVLHVDGETMVPGERHTLPQLATQFLH